MELNEEENENLQFDEQFEHTSNLAEDRNDIPIVKSKVVIKEKPQHYNTFEDQSLEENNKSLVFEPITDFNQDISYLQAISEIFWRFFPAAIMIFSCDGVLILCTLFFGIQDNSLNLSGCGLGVSMIYITILLVSIGVCDGMEALVSKAYGRKDYESCEIHLNQCRYMLLIFAVSQFLVFLFLEHIFSILRQPEQISHYAWIFCMLSFPGIILMNLFELNRRYLVCCGVNYSGTIITLSALALHAILLYLFIIFLDYGVYGAGISTTVSFVLTFVLFEIECCFQKEEVHKSKWRMPRGELIIRAKEFLNYTIPCCISMVSTWIPIEILNLFAGVLGSAQLNASVMFENILAFMYVFSMAFSYAISTSIGNSLGENRPNKAKKYFKAAVAICITLSLFFVILNVLGKEALISLYTSSDEEATQVRIVFELYIVDIAIEIFQIATYTTLIVLGYQFELLVLVLIVSWLIMLPLSTLLCFGLHFGFFGLCLIRTVSFLLIALINIFLLLRVNWEDAALEASNERE